MNSQKKRLAVYFLFISLGLFLAFVFLKKNTPTENTVSPVPIKKDSIVLVKLASFFTDLENNGDAFISVEKAASGKKSCKLSPTIEFGFLQANVVKDIPTFNNLKNISATFKCLFDKKDPEAVYVLSIDDSNGKNVFWDGKPIVYNTSSDWTEQTIIFNIPSEFLNPDNKISVYPWNKNKNLLYVDDIQIDYIGTAVYQETMSNQSEKSNLFFDFETEIGLSTADNVKETTAHSGKKACDLSGGKEYGPSVNKKLKDVSTAFPTKISLSVWVYPLTDNPNVVLTASVVNSKNETVFWDGESSENKSFPKNQWTKINSSFKFPIEKFNPEDVLGVGVWNKGKTDVLVDDLEIVYGESAERRGEKSKIDPISIYEKRFVPVKNKPPFKTIWMEKQEIGNELDGFTTNDVFIVGDFSPDPNALDELLCISKNKQALYAYNLSKNAFQKIWENNNPNDLLWKTDNVYNGNIVNGKHSLVIQQKNNPDATCLSFDGKTWQKTGSQKVVRSLAVINPISLFPGHFTSDKNQILKLDRTWRFDFKLLEGDNILGMVDFRGYANDYNPKYYEFVKLVTGNFLSSKQTSLLVVMCNCADSNFSGEMCNQIEALSFLPNKIELYSIKKEKNGTQSRLLSESQINADKK